MGLRMMTCWRQAFLGRAFAFSTAMPACARLAASALIDEADLPLHYSAERGVMIDRSGVCWPALEEKNNGLMADDPTVRFEAVLLNMFMCVEIFGLMRHRHC